MPINHVGNAGNISGYGEQNQNHFSDDSSEAEEQILELLFRHFELTEFEARAVIASIRSSGEDMSQLALGIRNGDESAIAQVEQYIP